MLTIKNIDGITNEEIEFYKKKAQKSKKSKVVYFERQNQYPIRVEFWENYTSVDVVPWVGY